MIELTWGQIRDERFHQAIQKVFKAPLGFDTGLKVISIVKAIDKEKELANPMWDKHIESFYTTEKGRVMGLKETADKAVEAEELAKIQDHKFSFQAQKITSKALESLTLTPQEIMALEPILEP
jgi:hypothetical protein